MQRSTRRALWGVAAGLWILAAIAAVWGWLLPDRIDRLVNIAACAAVIAATKVTLEHGRFERVYQRMLRMQASRQGGGMDTPPHGLSRVEPLRARRPVRDWRHQAM